MNNKKSNVLSQSERSKLAEIKGNFDLVDEIFGSEPGIYFDFDILPATMYRGVPKFLEIQSEFYAVLRASRTKV
jgi:hypothetical protein